MCYDESHPAGCDSTECYRMKGSQVAEYRSIIAPMTMATRLSYGTLTIR